MLIRIAYCDMVSYYLLNTLTGYIMEQSKKKSDGASGRNSKRKV